MSYTIEAIVSRLKEARERNNLSQRELSKLAGVPQSHISRIENGEVNLRLSSLIELARVLGLELALVPRSAMSAVNAIARTHSRPGREPASKSWKEYALLLRKASALAQNYPTTKEIAQLVSQIKDIGRLPVSEGEHPQARRWLKSIVDIERNSSSGELIEETRTLLAELRVFRNKRVQQVDLEEGARVKPAYSLESGDD